MALTERGCTIDITAFPVAEGEDAWSAEDALVRYLDAGAGPSRVTVSSDGGGCLPVFDGEGRVASFDVGAVGLRRGAPGAAQRGQPLERVLPAFTSQSGAAAAAAPEGAAPAGRGRGPGGARRGRRGGGSDGARAVARTGGAGRGAGGVRGATRRAAAAVYLRRRGGLAGRRRARRPYSWREGAGGGWPWIHHPGGWSGREDRRRHDPEAVRLAVRPGAGSPSSPPPPR